MDVKALTKGELRKLNALKKSIGDELGEEAFEKWLVQRNVAAHPADRNVEMIEEALNPLMDKIRIPRGAVYAIRRGRGRFIVEPVDLTA